MLEWFKSFMSLDERRVSCIMVMFMILCGCGVYMMKIVGDMPPQLTTLVMTLAGIIGGVNSLSGISSIIEAMRSGSIGGGYSNVGYGSNLFSNGYSGLYGSNGSISNQPTGVMDGIGGNNQDQMANQVNGGLGNNSGV
jgi:hypothetical protein